MILENESLDPMKVNYDTYVLKYSSERGLTFNQASRQALEEHVDWARNPKSKPSKKLMDEVLIIERFLGEILPNREIDVPKEFEKDNEKFPF